MVSLTTIRILDSHNAQSLRVSFPVYDDWGYRLDPKDAENCIEHLRLLGFPEPPEVILAQCGAAKFGEERNGKIYIFAHSSEPRFLHHWFFHEYGHQVEKRFLGNDLAEYLEIRGQLPFIPWDPLSDKEVFAEDFLVLFGTDLARQIPHSYKTFAGSALEDPERRQRLKAYVMSKIPKQDSGAPGEQQAGASRFSDVIGHWAADDIVKCVEVGLIKGYPDGTFRPEKQVTRAELATVLARLTTGAAEI
jgi:hypothetical protein